MCISINSIKKNPPQSMGETKERKIENYIIKDMSKNKGYVKKIKYYNMIIQRCLILSLCVI
jgi:tetrahydromethanopterin S-methyltransferase subunit F